MTIVEFLRARLDDEAESAPLAAMVMKTRVSTKPYGERLLREVEAKRQLLTVAFNTMAMIDSEWGCCHSADEIKAGRCPDSDPDGSDLFRALALPYADHQDYDHGRRRGPVGRRASARSRERAGPGRAHVTTSAERLPTAHS